MWFWKGWKVWTEMVLGGWMKGFGVRPGGCERIAVGFWEVLVGIAVSDDGWRAKVTYYE